MPKKNKKLPFWIFPGHWGLSGDSLEIAKIDYNFYGYESEILKSERLNLTEYEKNQKKIEIDLKYGKIDNYNAEILCAELKAKHKIISEQELSTELLLIKFDYKLISEKEFESSMIELLPDGYEKSKKTLDHLYKYHEILLVEYEKEISNLNKSPWFKFTIEPDSEFRSFEFKFDYNEYFVNFLKDNNHPGNDEQELIDNFVKDCGRKFATDDYEGDEDAKLQQANEELKIQTGTTEEGYRYYQ